MADPFAQDSTQQAAASTDPFAEPQQAEYAEQGNYEQAYGAEYESGYADPAYQGDGGAAAYGDGAYGDGAYADGTFDQAVPVADNSGGAFGDPFAAQGGAYEDDGPAYGAPAPSASRPKASAAAIPADYQFGLLTEADLAAREAAVAQKEEMLTLQEKSVANKEAMLKRQLGNDHNWPFKFYAVAYHSIPDEIPEGSQKIVKHVYWTFVASLVMFAFNWLASLIAWFSGSSTFGLGETLWATIYVIAAYPGMWWLWYHGGIYTLMQQENKKALSWIRFFIFYGGHIGFSVLAAVGVPGLSLAGLVMMADAFADGDDIVGIVFIINTAGWALVALASIYSAKEVYVVYRLSGATLAKAQQEATQMAATGVVRQSAGV